MMSLNSEISSAWNEWKTGVGACILLAIVFIACAAASGLFAIAVLIPLGWFFEWKPSDEAFYNLIIVFAVLLVPIGAKMAIKEIAETIVKDERERMSK